MCSNIIMGELCHPLYFNDINNIRSFSCIWHFVFCPLGNCVLKNCHTTIELEKYEVKA